MRMPEPPPIPLDRLKLLRSWARAYAKDPVDTQEPPYTSTNRKYRVEGDDAVAGAVYGAHMAPPSDYAAAEPWLIRGLLRENGRGRIVIAAVAIEHLFDPDAEVTSTVLHRLPLARIRDQALAYLRIGPTVEDVLSEMTGVPPTSAERRRIERIAEASSAASGRQSPEHFRRVALRALEISKSGRRDVVKELVAEESERAGREIPYQTVRGWVGRARNEFHFLAPTERGRSVWMPGPKLYVREED